MERVDWRQLNRNDLGVMAAGVAVFVFSLLPYWGASYKAGGVGFSASITAWHSYALLGLLLLFAAAALVAARVVFGVALPTLAVGWHVIAAGLAAVGTLLVIVRALTYPHASLPGGSYGVKWGGYLLFLAAVAETVFAVLALRESGETVTPRADPDGSPGPVTS